MEVSLTCQVCCNNPHKYTCPRCEMHTCSLACCLEHKQKFSCTGVREPVVYYRRNEYGTFAFQQDYHLLEEIDRKNNTPHYKRTHMLYISNNRLLKHNIYGFMRQDEGNNVEVIRLCGDDI
ncbi:unnamed protein product [Echinostoma caproni]|uniref:HIT-type domain-containing protein n=1 Tax=Echinostoma caproni TaxID=27848 RepID=A0A183B358_9TREM|nr:unnamed protein product [Echinostoma caproni]